MLDGRDRPRPLAGSTHARLSTGWKQAKTCARRAGRRGRIRGEQRLLDPAALGARSGSAARSGTPTRPAERSGGTPGIEYSACERSWSRRGIERKSASEYGWRIAAKSSSVPRALDDLAGVHHHHPVGARGDHAEVVRDQDHRHLQVAAQAVDQVEDLRLDRHVERGRRLVGDQQLRRAGERHRDHHALAQAAGELVRVVAEPLVGPRHADELEHLARPRAAPASA